MCMHGPMFAEPLPGVNTSQLQSPPAAVYISDFQDKNDPFFLPLDTSLLLSILISNQIIHI